MILPVVLTQITPQILHGQACMRYERESPNHQTCHAYFSYCKFFDVLFCRNLSAIEKVLSTCSKLLTSSNNDANNSDVTEHHDNESFKGFYPESFDRILLDPPCSALGLRPKLRVELTLQQLQRFPKYQKRLVRNAVSLLKVGGILTYSTCTIHAEENEGMCYHILHKYPFMKLLPIDKDNQKEDKQWGLPGFGLSDDERRCVKRYDPSLEDTVGFFIAKFIKISSDIKHISRE